MDLVVHHVLQALVVRRPEEDRRRERQAGVAVVQRLEAAQLKAKRAELLADAVDGDLLLEGRGIALRAALPSAAESRAIKIAWRLYGDAME